MRTIELAVAVFAVAASGAVVGDDLPLTPWGDPDFEGIYTGDRWVGVPLQRPEDHDEPGGADEEPGPAAASLIVEPADGRLPPVTAEGRRRAAARQAERRRPPLSYTDFSLRERCISRGLAGAIIPDDYGSGTQILQAPGYVVLRHEMLHEARVIPLDGRPHAHAGVRMWMGDSRGHWDGGTLVIETTHFTSRTGLGPQGEGPVHGENLRTRERISRIDGDTLRYELTVDDPDTYTRPWTLRFELDAKPGYELYEHACHEGNYGLANRLSDARAEEAAAGLRSSAAEE